jgi:16S rRNA (uracil1498-N3)-methyltransferase
MPVFYQPDLSTNPFLDESESRHAVKVLRLGAGDRLRVADGRGGWYEAEITRPDARRCALRILSRTVTEQRPFHVHLAIAPTKNLDRMEWMLEKCVEIGLDEISFLETRYSERRSLKLERLHNLAVSALKQSGQGWLPTLNGMVRFGEFLSTLSTAPSAQRFIAHLAEGERKLLHHEAKPNQQYVALVGPEGDFSEEEVRQALAAGFRPVSLGPSRLRTETAGLVAVHTLNLVNQ